MKKFTLLGIIIFLSLTSYSQENLTEQQVQEYMEIGSQIEGTFQIQMIDTRSLPTFPLELYPMIKEARKENEVIYIYPSGNMRIKIYSKNLIDSENFVPAARITHINSSDI